MMDYPMEILGFHIFDLFPVLVFFISFFGLLISDHVVKSIVLVTLMQTSVILLWLGIGARLGSAPPLFPGTEYIDTYAMEGVADPLPQALMLTAIIIGIAVTAVNITLLNGLFRKYKVLDWVTMQHKAEQAMYGEGAPE
jgi:multicomponent Na+:H+ antiporter subunit C